MTSSVPCILPAGYDGTAILEQLDHVLDPELDESILQLGFVRALQVDAGHATVVLQLPTSWCSVNFAYLMADDVRRALLTVEGIARVTVRLSDHCAAATIEAAVNAGQSFTAAFPGEASENLDTLRLTFLRKGFLGRQERLLHALRHAGYTPEAICALRLSDALGPEGVCRLWAPPQAQGEHCLALTLQRYLTRRAALGLDCTPMAYLIVDLDGQPLSAAGLQAYYQTVRTVRVAMEANGSFCSALLAVRQPQALAPHRSQQEGDRDVHP
jgi:metal-sulfur cluster biosynthetic enzyme